MDHFGEAAFDEKYLKNLLLADPTGIARALKRMHLGLVLRISIRREEKKFAERSQPL